MFRLSLVLALSIALLAVVFALQNAYLITIQFLFWQSQGSLALVLLLTAGLGAIAGLLVSVPTIVNRNRKIHAQRKRIEELQSSLSREVELLKSPQPQTPEQPL